MSTHAIMRTGVLQLQRWGLPIVMAATTPEIRSTTFHYGAEQLRIKMKPEHGLDYLAAPLHGTGSHPRRRGACIEADVRHGVQLSDLHYGAAGRVIGATLTDDMGQQRVDALGHRHRRRWKAVTVATLVYASKYRAARTTSACVCGYFENLDREGFPLAFCRRCCGEHHADHAQHCVVASVPDAAFSKTFRGQVEEGFFEVLRENSPVLHDDVRRANWSAGCAAPATSAMRQAHGRAGRWSAMRDTSRIR